MPIVLDTVRAGRLAPNGHESFTTLRLEAFVREHATLYTARMLGEVVPGVRPQ